MTAKIVPVHKKGLALNYCPIIPTSIVVKVMEGIIHRQLVHVLDISLVTPNMACAIYVQL